MTVRALVIDDSPTMRAIISGILSSDPEIEVVGTADCPGTARAMIKDLNPDVLTLDIEMPGMNGLDFLEKIMALRPTPVVMVSTLAQKDADATIRALELGAVDCYAKPNGKFALSTTGDGGQLARMVVNAGRSRVYRRAAPVRSRTIDRFAMRADAVIAIGASTGGVEALITLLQSWPEDCPPTLIVQHMPALFTTSFAARLDRLCRAHVAEAVDGEPLAKGRVYLAPGGERHLEVQGTSMLRCRLVPDAPMNGHRPSVDRLFNMVARHVGGAAVGAILTGMGKDGAAGLHAIRETGALTVGQDEATCVVYGMPAAAHKIGAVKVQLPIQRMAGCILEGCKA